MSWEIVTGIIALSGFCVTIGTLTARLSAVIVRLDASVKALTREYAQLREETQQMRRTVEHHERRFAVMEGERWREGQR